MPNTKRNCQHTEKIVVHDHDVLNGRGVNIAQHPGNLRFRALVKSHADQNYCSDYSTSAKKALAEEIISHIRNLNPPGRFLKRPARTKKSDVDSGTWEELTEKETLKKACQALRDCNRGDRSEYAKHIDAPEDVQVSKVQRERSGLSNREYAERIASESISRAAALALAANPPPVASTRHNSYWVDTSPAAETEEEPNAVESLTTTTPKATTTPATVASSGAFHSYPEDNETGHFDEHLVSAVPLPFADHFTNSPTQASGLDYDPFHLDEEHKVQAIDRETNNFVNAFDDGCHDSHDVLLNRPLDDHTDFTTVFDGDLTI